MDNDEIEERDYERTCSNISQFDKSNFNSQLSDIWLWMRFLFLNQIIFFNLLTY